MSRGRAKAPHPVPGQVWEFDRDGWVARVMVVAVAHKRGRPSDWHRCQFGDGTELGAHEWPPEGAQHVRPRG